MSANRRVTLIGTTVVLLTLVGCASTPVARVPATRFEVTAVQKAPSPTATRTGVVRTATRLLGARTIESNGRRVAYVVAGALHVQDVPSGEPRVLALDPDEAVSWGLADFAAAEEMGRMRGYWWSPDGAWIAAARGERTAAASRSPRSRIAAPAPAVLYVLSSCQLRVRKNGSDCASAWAWL